jgi:DNA-binding transcriptional LysR family regulator
MELEETGRSGNVRGGNERRAGMEAGADHENLSCGTVPLGEMIEYLCAVAVAEQLHFTRAAQRLRLDQSAVSRHIHKLESRLGTRLFVRTPRGAELTEAGCVLIPFAERVLLAARTGESLTRSIARGEPDRIEVAYAPQVDVRILARIRKLVAEAGFPTPVHFQSTPYERLTDCLSDGTSHVAIGLLPVGGDIESRCIWREPLVVALPATHRLARRRAIPAAELGGEPAIQAFGSPHSRVSCHISALLRAAGYSPSVTHHAHSATVALALAREGFGVAIVKASELHLRPEGVVLRSFTGTSLVVETGMLWVGVRQSRPVDNFISLVGSLIPTDVASETYT